jgi:hypothetical protein
MNIKYSDIILIDFRLYNEKQLSVIADIISSEESGIIEMKRSGVIKLWFVKDSPINIGIMTKESIGVTNSVTYKGLGIVCDFPLTKKDKDFLLKMKPTVFDTKVRKTIKESVDIKTDVSKQEVISIDDLKSELLVCLENEDYEQASIIRDKIKLWKIE